MSFRLNNCSLRDYSSEQLPLSKSKEEIHCTYSGLCHDGAKTNKQTKKQIHIKLENPAFKNSKH